MIHGLNLDRRQHQRSSGLVAKEKWFEILVRVPKRSDQRPLRQVMKGKSFADVRDKAHKRYGESCLVQVVTTDNVRLLNNYQ